MCHGGEQRVTKLLAEITRELAWESGSVYSMATNSPLSQVNDLSERVNAIQVARILSPTDPKMSPGARRGDVSDGTASDGVLLSGVVRNRERLGSPRALRQRDKIHF